MNPYPSKTLVDNDRFRSVVGHFASGVTVITTKVDGELFGTTASAVSSLSMDPPMMLICLNRSSQTHGAVKAAGAFAINILAADQDGLAYKFAKKGTDKFLGVDTDEVEGMPTLRGALATLVCRTVEETSGGTHTVFLAEVLEADSSDAEPLAYYRGKFGRFNPDAETSAYQKVRDWVLTRRDLRNTSVEIDSLVHELGIPRDQLSRAVVKLAADRLVMVGMPGSFTVLPITSELMLGCLDGRAAIQCGVLHTSMDSMNEEVVSEIRGIFDQMASAKNSHSTQMATFFELNSQLQNLVIGLSGSYELVQAFNRMGLGAVWTETVPADAWADIFDDTYQRRFVEALENRDVTAACAAVQNHAETTKKLASKMIDSHGGEV